MTEFWQAMALPLAACFILAGIHAYLGLHVIEREVIFVDLALAQIAALGAGLSVLAGWEWESPGAYGLSLAFTIIGAAVFSLTRRRKPLIPQEAIIGITYAVAAAALMLILSRSGEGDEHLRQAFMGNILLTPASMVWKMAALYAVIGAFHFVYRKRFLLISRDPEKAYGQGWNVALWDFLFYASFGLVVTGSVRVAGVLLVFAYLVVPAATAVLFSRATGARLAIGWGVGLVASALGVAASYIHDLPTSASVVCALGLLLLLAASFKAAFK